MKWKNNVLYQISLSHNPKNHWLWITVSLNHEKMFVWNASIWVDGPCRLFLEGVISVSDWLFNDSLHFQTKTYANNFRDRGRVFLHLFMVNMLSFMLLFMLPNITSVSKKSGQTIVLYYYCGLSSFFCFFLKTDVTKIRNDDIFRDLTLVGMS